MDPQGEDVDGAAVFVEAWIDDMLVIAGPPQPASSGDAVKRIERGFRAGPDGPVPDETIDASHTQVLRMHLRDPSEVDPTPATSLGRRHSEPLASNPKEAELSAAV